MPTEQDPVGADDEDDQDRGGVGDAGARWSGAPASSTSTITMPAKAVADEAWPDGKEWLLSRCSGSCHIGRSRPIRILSRLVATAVTIITPAVKYAAPPVALDEHHDRQHGRRDRHPDGAEGHLDPAQQVVQPGSSTAQAWRARRGGRGRAAVPSPGPTSTARPAKSAKHRRPSPAGRDEVGRARGSLRSGRRSSMPVPCRAWVSRVKASAAPPIALPHDRPPHPPRRPRPRARRPGQARPVRRGRRSGALARTRPGAPRSSTSRPSAASRSSSAS